MRRIRPFSKERPPLVGVVVDGLNSYGRGVLRGVMRYANLQRRWLLHQDIWRVGDSLLYWPACDAAILAGTTPAIFQHIRQRCPHVIHCSGSGDPAVTPVVSLDDEAAGAMAARHLMDCRLERFAFYGAARHSVAAKRFNGFKSALAARGYDCFESTTAWPSPMDLLTHTHRPQLTRWLADLPKPVGIFASDDSAAHDLAGTCREANIGVPDHVAIIGVNNDDLLCESAWPPLSSIEADFSRMGYEAAKMLDRLFAGETLRPEEREVKLPPLTVVQRVSTSTLAVADVNLADAIRYIREHACDPCSVDDVLHHVPVGRRWLERQLAATIGRTPHEEIVRVRIEAARRLLTQPDLVTEDVATRCGYSTAQAFHRAFYQSTGFTPAAFRRNATRGAIVRSI